ncbi:MAG: RNA methyltransferase [Thermoplasmatales archaeon]|nr:MAG: RNA methyltransferase [Thermoplasmatales archaeon]
MVEFYIILVEPKYGGNVGAVARLMANFEFNNLYLVNPCELDDECYSRSMHAHKILDNASIFSSFAEAVKDMDYLVATSSIESKNEKRYLRNAILPEDFSNKIFELDGKIGVLFGREDYGLYNDEIAACDIVLRIPTSESYLSLNLSHAACLILYILYLKKKFIPSKRKKIGKIEKEKLYEFFSNLLDSISYPKHKKENTEVMFKRIMGRAMPSKWEYHTMMGVFAKSIEKIEQNKENRKH